MTSPVSRRRFIGGAAASVAALAAGRGGRLVEAPAWAGPAGRRAQLVLPPGTRPFPQRPEGIDTLPQVEHIVIYMQENHSFDSYFGLLGRGDGLTIGPDGRPTNTNPDSHGRPVPMFHMPSTCDHTNSAGQDWNGTHRSWNHGRMDGFVTAAGDATGSMGYWDKSDLPFYDGLARTFVLCDRWFTSVMGQTLPNRRYLQAATSAGLVSSDVNEVLKIPNVPNGCIWDRLNQHGISWADYAIDLPDILLFFDFARANQHHIKKFGDFLLDAETGALPQVSIISPGHNLYSEENPNDIQLGEAYSAAIINALMHGPAWERTVLLFMWDEHGGSYDHVPPPKAIAPDSIKPDISVPPDEPGGFDQYGMRVPALVISPFAKKDYVSSVVHDHTSVLKFIETKFNLGAMTYRDANADDLMDCFDFAGVPFRDPPQLPAPGLPRTGSSCSAVAPPETSVPIPATTSTTTTTAPGPVGRAPAGGAVPVPGAPTFTG